ncbi:MAG: lipid-A-disaccharide synthase [Alphaproteobacteria bacterium]|nr:MAG: lipid-A-disaccharide synthase [Alphaproteobacteria bacterium]
MSGDRPRVFLLAGEASGDRLGADLLRALRARAPGLAVAGVGGALMAAEGLESLFPMEELSLIGLAEVLPRLPALRRRLAQATEAALAFDPDVVVTIDSPDFSLRLARRIKAARPDLPTVHYVAPTVWAWRPGRARRMRGAVDHVLCLYPFEPRYMEAAGLGASFVGHPIAAEPVPPEAARAALRRELGIGPGELLVAALPGSRRSEVNRLAPRLGEALGRVARGRALSVVVPAAPPVAAQVAEAVARWPLPVRLIDPRALPPAEADARKRLALAAADAALAVSGTVTLELAALGTPMVVAYDLARPSWWILRRLVRTPWASMVNILHGAKVIPERLGPACTAGALAEALAALLDDPAARARQRAAFDEALAWLGRGGPAPGERAAEVVLELAGAGRP